MGWMDKVKGAISKDPEKARGAIDKAAALAQKRAGAKHRGTIDKVAGRARGYVDGLGGDVRTDRPATGRSGRSARAGRRRGNPGTAV